jgi:hypothetical protein
MKSSNLKRKTKPTPQKPFKSGVRAGGGVGGVIGHDKRI